MENSFSTLMQWIAKQRGRIRVPGEKWTATPIYKGGVKVVHDFHGSDYLHVIARDPNLPQLASAEVMVTDSGSFKLQYWF